MVRCGTPILSAILSKYCVDVESILSQFNLVLSTSMFWECVDDEINIANRITCLIFDIYTSLLIDLLPLLGCVCCNLIITLINNKEIVKLKYVVASEATIEFIAVS